MLSTLRSPTMGCSSTAPLVSTLLPRASAYRTVCHAIATWPPRRLPLASADWCAGARRHSSKGATTSVTSLIYSSPGGDVSDKLRAHRYEVKHDELPPSHAIVRIYLASINPADINVLQGNYPYLPRARQLPGLPSDRPDGIATEKAFIGGNEGYGAVEYVSPPRSARTGDQGDRDDGAPAAAAAKGKGASAQPSPPPASSPAPTPPPRPSSTSTVDIKVGDRVVFGRPQMGTWTTHMVAPVRDLIKIPDRYADKLVGVMSSTLMVNPATAYRMLTDFVKLEPGDIIIQNTANSAVGQAVIEIAGRAMGVETINLVRDRPEIDALRERMAKWGRGGVGTHVFTYDELRDKRTEIRDRLLRGGRKIKLGLNGLCGRDAANMVKLMGEDSTLVTYGAMSQRPLSMPAGAVIFSNITSRGFQMARWYQTHSRQEREELMARLAGWYVEERELPLVVPAARAPEKHEANGGDGGQGEVGGEARRVERVRGTVLTTPPCDYVNLDARKLGEGDDGAGADDAPDEEELLRRIEAKASNAVSRALEGGGRRKRFFCWKV